jgi:hypothetical protein
VKRNRVRGGAKLTIYIYTWTVLDDSGTPRMCVKKVKRSVGAKLHISKTKELDAKIHIYLYATAPRIVPAETERDD